MRSIWLLVPNIHLWRGHWALRCDPTEIKNQKLNLQNIILTKVALVSFLLILLRFYYPILLYTYLSNINWSHFFMKQIKSSQNKPMTKKHVMHNVWWTEMLGHYCGHRKGIVMPVWIFTSVILSLKRPSYEAFLKRVFILIPRNAFFTQSNISNGGFFRI